MFNALTGIILWPTAILVCVDIRLQVFRLIRNIRSVSYKASVEELRELSSKCNELYELYMQIEGELGPCNAWLLKKPFIHWQGLCIDLALAADPEARELVRKIGEALA
jgi:hypothetical protein